MYIYLSGLHTLYTDINSSYQVACFAVFVREFGSRLFHYRTVLGLYTLLCRSGAMQVVNLLPFLSFEILRGTHGQTGMTWY